MTEILGYTAFIFQRGEKDLRSKQPINRGSSRRKVYQINKSRRSVFAIAPINAAVTASGTGLLNIMEKPNTPQKLARSRNRIQSDNGNEILESQPAEDGESKP